MRMRPRDQAEERVEGMKINSSQNSITAVWTDDIPSLLCELGGITVSVCVSSLPMKRATEDEGAFHSQISVKGNLEIRQTESDDDPPEVRVFIEPGTYCYFQPEDVMSVVVKEEPFKDGAFAIIFLGIDQKLDPEPIKKMLDEAMKKMNEKENE